MLKVNKKDTRMTFYYIYYPRSTYSTSFSSVSGDDFEQV